MGFITLDQLDDYLRRLGLLEGVKYEQFVASVKAQNSNKYTDGDRVEFPILRRDKTCGILVNIEKDSTHQPAPCGYGYNKMCCCCCAFQLIAKPRCGCLGGPGKMCKDTPIKKSQGGLGALASEAVDEDTSYVCTVFANEGTVITDWTEHGVCEGWVARDGYTGADE